MLRGVGFGGGRDRGRTTGVPVALGVVLLAAGGAAACAAHRFSLPAGPPGPVADAAAIWAAATRRCRNVERYQAELHLSGRVNGARVPGLTVGLALDGQGHIAVEARVAGSSVFLLAGTAARATLLLRNDHRVVTGPAADIVEALVGAPLGPARLEAVLSGCVATDLTLQRAGEVRRPRRGHGGRRGGLPGADRGWLAAASRPVRSVHR